VIVYEVRIVLDPAIAEEYRAWLETHIREILAIPGFSGAELLAEDDEGERPVWTTRYHLEGREALERYLRDHAPRLRAEGTTRFGGRFQATRRVSELVREFP
jgi:antibiotic biosynthesis monooxygenase (ABM) superfamily enzyme